ncbi:MAG TPA: GAF domain-containing protein [Acidimicrobiia bacterium]|nr:GAF domain-containing protein [Acidimicrobiia bacterium]
MRTALDAATEQLAQTRTLPEVQAVVRVAARALLKADGATFVLREAERCFYADEDAMSPLWKGQRFPVEHCISGWAMLNRRAAIVPDIEKDDRIPIEAYRPTFVKSLLMVPIRQAAPVGAIGAYWARAHRATDAELELLTSLATAAAEALDRVGFENAPYAPSRLA